MINCAASIMGFVQWHSGGMMTRRFIETGFNSKHQMY
jgi:hypothetical protein